MSIIIDGTNGITLPSGAVSNTTGAVVGTTDTQTLTNKNIVASQLTGTQTIPRGTLPTGSVLQVVSAVSSTQYSTTSSSLTGTLSLAITPSSTSSKILLNWMIAGGVNGGSNVGAHWALYRNGSSVADYAYVLYNSSGSAGQMLNPVPIIYYDSPATTSAVTYQLYIGTSGTTTVTINNYYYSYLILQEISA